MSGFLNHTPKQSSKQSSSSGGTPKKWNIFRSSSNNRTPPPPPPPSSSPSLPIHKENFTISYSSRPSPQQRATLSTLNENIKVVDTHNQLHSSPRSYNTSQSPYPRTTSLPRSTTSTSTLNTVRTPTEKISEPPKVKPFYQKSSPNNQFKKKSLINKRCCFCEELLSTTIGTEKVIELKCGDIAHEECLYLMLNDDIDINNEHKLFPVCQACGKLAIPKDETLMNSITSRYLTQAPAPREEIVVPIKRNLNPIEEFDKFQSLSLHQSKNSKDLSITLPDPHVPKPYRDSLLPNPYASLQYSHLQNSKVKSRGSSISAISSIVSSVPKTPSPTMSSFSDPSAGSRTISNDDASLVLLRSKFISHLVNVLKFTEINEKVINSYGYLRLVDSLLISTKDDSRKFKQFIVYLFQHNLIILSPNFKKFKNVELPKKIIKIQTLNQSTIKIIIPNKQNDTVYIQNNKSSILSKWITAFCDPETVFDTKNLSTTRIPADSLFNDGIEMVHGDAKSNGDLDIVSEISNFEKPVMLSPISLASPAISTPVNGIHSNNSKSSRNLASDCNISTFFSKTSNLVVCLNLTNPLNPKNLKTVINIFRVLDTKFQSLNLIYCVNGSVISRGTINDIPFTESKLTTTNVLLEEEINKTLVPRNATKETHCLLHICTYQPQSTSSTQGIIENIKLENQLHLNINESNFSIQSDHSNTSNVITTTSWDNVMEIITSKFDLNFGYESDIDNNVDFDSDGFKGQSFYSGDETFEKTTTGFVNNDTAVSRDEGESYDVKDEITSLSEMDNYGYDVRDEISSLSGSEAELDIGVAGDDDDYDSESEYDRRDEISNRSEDISQHNSGWSTLLNDIETALNETVTSPNHLIDKVAYEENKL